MSNTLNLGAGNWGVKDSSLLGYNSENGNFKPLPFNFERSTSATRVNKEGLIEVVSNNEPRVDYKDDSKGALLLEPSRSNLITYSEDFSQSVWTAQSGISITPNSGVSPKGDNTANQIVSTNGTTGFFFSGLSVTNSAIRSLYLKGEVGGESVTLKDPSGFGTPVTYTLTTEWQRLTLSTTNDGNTYQGLFIDDISIGTIYAWGAQLEQGSYATSYIPTQGSVATRVADACSQQNDYVLSNTSGTIFFKLANYDTNTSPNGFNKILVFQEVSSSSLDNSIYFEEYNGENTILLKKGGTTLLQSTPNYQDLRGSKIGIKFSNTEAKIFINGVLNNTYTGDSSLSLEYFGFDNPYNGDIVSSIKLKDLKLYNTALTDQELINLTTI